MSEVKMLINGHAIGAEETFSVLNPATEEVIAQCPKATTQQLDEAVMAARSALPA